MNLQLNDQWLKKIIDYCGGDSSKIGQCIQMIKDYEITTLEELTSYPMRQHYTSFLQKEEAPTFYSIYIENRDDYERHEIITLEQIIDDIEEDIIDKDLIKDLTKELIEHKYGSMEYDW